MPARRAPADSLPSVMLFRPGQAPTGRQTTCASIHRKRARCAPWTSRDLARRRHAPPAHRRRRRDGGRRRAAGAAQAATRPKAAARRADATADVVVVGAGLAGLTAARDLVAAGEVGRRARGARPRGRARAQRRPRRRRDHRGRRGVHRPHAGPHRRAGQGRRRRDLPDLQHGDNVYFRNGAATPYSSSGPLGPVPPDPTGAAEAEKAILQLDQMASTIPLDAPWTAPTRRGVGRPDLRDLEARQHGTPLGALPARRRDHVGLLGRAARRLAALRPLLPRRGGQRVDAGEHRAAGQHRRRRAGAPLRRRLAARADQARQAPRASASCWASRCAGS